MMKELKGVFVIEEDLTIKELEEYCEKYAIKYNCRPLIVASTKRIARMLNDTAKGYRLAPKEEINYKLPSVIDMGTYSILETREQNDLIYIIKVSENN